MHYKLKQSMLDNYQMFVTTFLCSLLLLVSNSYALQIDPLRTMIQVEAGKKTTGTITLTNNKEEVINLVVSLRNSTMQNAQSEEVEWLSLETGNLSIESKQQLVLEYHVLIPEGATGECKSRIAFLEVPASSNQGEMVSINTKISVPFFATIKGTEVCDFEVASFEITNDLKDVAALVVENRGNVHVRPSGTCSIKKMGEGQTVQSTRVNKTNYPIFPGEKKEFKVEFDKPLTPGKYVAELQLESSTQVSHATQKSFEFEIVDPSSNSE
jgi:P pilus assembly chaperone PapD